MLQANSILDRFGPIWVNTETELLNWSAICAYGFNVPESGFVWSTHEFGIRVHTDKTTRLSFSALDRKGHTLAATDGDKAWSYELQDGNQFIDIPPLAGGVCHFKISPPKVYLIDTRELGIMLLSVVSAEGDVPTLKPQKHPQFSPRDPFETRSFLVKRLLRSFVDRGCMKLSMGTAGDIFNISVRVTPPINRAATDWEIWVDSQKTQVSFKPSADGDYYSGALTHPVSSSFDIEVKSPADYLFPMQSFHWRGYGNVPLPPSASIVRVAGLATIESFCLGGATWFEKMKAVVKLYGTKEFDSMKILDWGTGCARILRFFSQTQYHNLSGVDIDPINIEWSRQNFPGPSFHLIHNEGALPYADGSMDLIFGHSVFTHLTELDQFRWLAELERVLAPDGLCLVTAWTEPSMYWVLYDGNSCTPEALEKYLRDGFIDYGHFDIGVDINSKGSYRGVAHTEQYVRDNWSRYFKVLDIIPTFANEQSLVVLRKRPTVLTDAEARRADSRPRY